MIVVDNTSKQVKAYVGNQMASSTPFRFVDMAQAKRSSGSTLKPFLYASAIEQSHILPNSLIRDVPISFDGYQPKNFNEEFHGLVPADEALSRSLNIPFVNLLYNYGLPIFYEDLQQLGLHEIDKGSEHYGLTLILGGAEVSLWELTKAYVNFKSIYTNYVENSSQYSTENISELNPFEGDINKKPELSFTPSIWSAASVYFSMEAMTNLNRPEDINTISLLGQEQQIAWKTGTSFGFKDAWSIGINDDYTIGVWVGNADAEGRPQLTGVKAAAPIMFEMFRELPRTNNWLQPPFDDLKKDKICNFSGWPVTSHCENYTEQYVPARHIKRKNCPYHVSLSVDKSEQFQVNRNCYPARELKTKSFVKLSPVERYYIKLSNFKAPPPMHPNCKQSEQANVMEFIYPRSGESIILPKSFDENDEEVALKLAHAKNETVYWYLDKNYLTTTEEIHEISLYLEPGNYEISVVDSQGHQLRQNLTVKER
jgi:penicillin-binding protein 1C